MHRSLAFDTPASNRNQNKMGFDTPSEMMVHIHTEMTSTERLFRSSRMELGSVNRNSCLDSPAKEFDNRTNFWGHAESLLRLKVEGNGPHKKGVTRYTVVTRREYVTNCLGVARSNANLQRNAGGSVRENWTLADACWKWEP